MSRIKSSARPRLALEPLERRDVPAANAPPVLGDVPADLRTAPGTPVSFAVPYTDPDGDAGVIDVRDLDFAGSPDRFGGAVDQANREVTLIPAAGFMGTVAFRVGVRDQTDRVGAGLDSGGNFATRVVRLTVGDAPAASAALTAAPTTTRPGGPVALTAAVTGPGGRVEFRDATGVLAEAEVVGGQAQGTVTFPAAGPRAVVARYFPAGQAAAAAESAPVELTVVATPEPPPTPPPSPAPAGPVTAVGSAPGQAPRVVIRNADGSTRFDIPVFDPGFTGGVRVAVADVTGDGVEEVVAVPGFGGGSIVTAFSTMTGQEVFSRVVFEDTFRGGLNLAVGDARGLGYAQVLVGAGDTGGPRVTLLDIRRDAVLLNYFAYDPLLRGGVSVGMVGPMAGQAARIVTGPGPGGGPVVAVFDGRTGRRVGEFLAGDPADRGGIVVRAGDVDPRTGARPVVVGPAAPAADRPEQTYDLSEYID